MEKCFVIQPFDGGKYDKRYEDVFAPAIKAANMKPYRVDQDISVDVPIESIEREIRDSSICLADITTNNPNVWYELGFAFALGKQVLMLCSNERTSTKYPFDIQHRTVVAYEVDSSSDFEKLKASITDRLKVLIKKEDTIQNFKKQEQLAPIHGLTQPELGVLAVIAGSGIMPTESVSAYSVKHDVERSGFTPIAYAIGLKRLLEKRLVRIQNYTDRDGDVIDGILINPIGWDWIAANEEKFILRRKTENTDQHNHDVPF